MKGVNFDDDTTTVNWIVPMFFVGVKALLIIIVSSIKCRHQRIYQAVTQARNVFVKDGYLSKPSVIRGQELDAIVRGWMSPGHTTWLILLNIVNSSPYLSMSFSWNHDQIVFTRADKSFLLYTAAISTFLAVAFFDTKQISDKQEVQQDKDIPTSLLDPIVTACFVSILFMPVKYIFPFMISQVNTFSTSTYVPASFVSQHFQGIMHRLSCLLSRKRKLKHKQPIRRRSDKNKVSSFDNANVQQTPALPASIAKNSHSLTKSHVTTKAYIRWQHATKLLAKHKSLVQKRSLKFLNYKVFLPVWKREIKSFDIQLTARQCNILSRLQKKIKRKQHQKKMIRRFEFQSWQKNLRSERQCLAVITYIFVAVVSLFTLALCILLSTAFTDEECVAWSIAVIKSVVTGALLIEPALVLSVLAVKIIGSWILLRLDSAGLFSSKRSIIQKGVAVADEHSRETKLLADTASSKDNNLVIINL